MLQPRPATSDRATFPRSSLDWAAHWSRLCPGWTIKLDEDDTHDLITLSRTSSPRATSAAFAIMPAADGVLMSSIATGWRLEVAFPSLCAALLSVRSCRIDPIPERPIAGGSVTP
jgi:hypothetical protein